MMKSSFNLERCEIGRLDYFVKKNNLRYDHNPIEFQDSYRVSLEGTV